MTEGQRPYGGTNQADGGLPGERPEQGSVDADPANSPRAAQGGMSDDVTRVPDNAGDDPDAKAPGIADATGPQG
jgi:hypothetical protein